MVRTNDNTAARPVRNGGHRTPPATGHRSSQNLFNPASLARPRSVRHRWRYAFPQARRARSRRPCRQDSRARPPGVRGRQLR